MADLDIPKLYDDVIGVIISHVPDKTTLAAACVVSKQFNRVFRGILTSLNMPHVEYYYNPNVSDWAQKLPAQLHKFTETLRMSCYAQNVYTPSIIQQVRFSICDQCFKPPISYDRTLIKFFRLHPRGINDATNSIDTLYVDTVEICHNCAFQIKHKPPTYYIGYTLLSSYTPPLRLPNYRIKRAVMLANRPIVITDFDDK